MVRLDTTFAVTSSVLGFKLELGFGLRLDKLLGFMRVECIETSAGLVLGEI